MIEHELESHENYEYLVRYAYALLRGREDIDDIVQTTLERAWKNRHLYNPQRSNIRTWLVSLLRNIAKDQFRTDRTRCETVTVLSIDDLIEMNWNNDEQDASLAYNPDYDTRIGLEQALSRLGGVHEQVVRLCFIGGYTFAEVADKLQISRRKIRRILATALKRLNGIMRGLDKGT